MDLFDFSRLCVGADSSFGETTSPPPLISSLEQSYPKYESVDAPFMFSFDT
jgi:hypothetical protein